MMNDSITYQIPTLSFVGIFMYVYLAEEQEVVQVDCAQGYQELWGLFTDSIFMWLACWPNYTVGPALCSIRGMNTQQQILTIYGDLYQIRG
jgi:hypothetical protein